MTDSEQQTESSESEDSRPVSDEAERAQKAQEAHEAAQDKMKELEEMDEPPTDLEDWPSDEAKYVTYGGGEGEHSYAEGPEAKLGPSDLERRPDGSVLVEGEEVDNPDDYKADPVPGGPTDPDSPELPGERKKREKMKKMYGDDTVPEGLEKDGSSSEQGDSAKGEGDADSS